MSILASLCPSFALASSALFNHSPSPSPSLPPSLFTFHNYQWTHGSDRVVVSVVWTAAHWNLPTVLYSILLYTISIHSLSGIAFSGLYLTGLWPFSFRFLWILHYLYSPYYPHPYIHTYIHTYIYRYIHIVGLVCIRES